MVYMYEVSVPAVAASSAASMFGPAARSQSSYLGLSFLFIVILLASAVWQIDALGKFSPRQMAVIGAAEPPPPGAGPVVSPPGQRWLAPRLEIACHVSMCFAMAYMLVLML